MRRAEEKTKTLPQLPSTGNIDHLGAVLTMSRNVLLLAIGLIFSTHCYAQTASSDEDYQAKLDELRVIIEQVKKEIGQVRDSKNELVDELESNEKDIGSLSKKADSIEKELDHQKKQLALLRQQRNQVNQNKNEQAVSIRQHIVSAYKLGHQSNLKTLLNQEDTELSARMVKYHEYIVNARTDRIAEYQATLEKLTALDREITTKTERFARQKQNLEQQRNALEAANTKRKQTLARLNQQLRQQGKQLSSLTQEQADLEQLIKEVAQVILAIPTPEDHNPFNHQRGKLKWPVKGKIKHRFASAKAAGRLTWDGVLITTKRGAEVSAVHGGRVVFSDWLKGQGMLLIVDHGDGYLSLYGHNETLFKEVGDWVNKNEVIALAGSTGGRSEPGLYFEIREDGKPLNPAKWCRG